MFHRMLEKQGLPLETEPYRKALDSDEALRAVYNYYGAIPLWQRDRLPKVPNAYPMSGRLNQRTYLRSRPS